MLTSPLKKKKVMPKGMLVSQTNGNPCWVSRERFMASISSEQHVGAADVDDGWNDAFIHRIRGHVTDSSEFRALASRLFGGVRETLRAEELPSFGSMARNEQEALLNRVRTQLLETEEYARCRDASWRALDAALDAEAEALLSRQAEARLLASAAEAIELTGHALASSALAVRSSTHSRPPSALKAHPRDRTCLLACEFLGQHGSPADHAPPVITGWLATRGAQALLEELSEALPGEAPPKSSGTELALAV